MLTKLQKRIRREMVYRPTQKQEIKDELWKENRYKFNSKKDFDLKFERVWRKLVKIKN